MTPVSFILPRYATFGMAQEEAEFMYDIVVGRTDGDVIAVSAEAHTAQPTNVFRG